MTSPVAATVFDDLVGQERVASALCAAVTSGSLSHAYLFAGPQGTGKAAAAIALACALMCDSGGCGTCPACARVRRGAHPDVRVVEPQGAASYLVEQIRDDLVPDMWLAPAEGAVKVYIINRADALGEASASAFLKALEEPPPKVTIVLLTDDIDAMLPTIVSRCQVVRFAPIAPSLAVQLLADRAGASEDATLAALAATGGVLPRAIEFLRAPSRQEARERVLAMMRDLPVMDGRDILASAREMLRDVRAPLDEMKERQETELRERVEFMGRAAGSMKDAETRHRRELTAREREGIGELLNVVESWLRDALAAGSGAPEMVANRDAADDVEAAGACMSPVALQDALGAVGRARRRVSYNVSPQLAVEAMLFEIQEARLCPRSWD